MLRHSGRAPLSVMLHRSSRAPLGILLSLLCSGAVSPLLSLDSLSAPPRERANDLFITLGSCVSSGFRPHQIFGPFGPLSAFILVFCSPPLTDQFMQKVLKVLHCSPLCLWRHRVAPWLPEASGDKKNSPRRGKMCRVMRGMGERVRGTSGKRKSGREVRGPPLRLRHRQTFFHSWNHF